MVYVSLFSQNQNHSGNCVTFFNNVANNGLYNDISVEILSGEHKLIHNLVINKYIDEITTYYNHFANGEYDIVIKALDDNTFAKISKELYELHVNEQYSDYEFILRNIINSFNSLMKSIQQYLTLQSVKKQLEYETNKASILDDIEKLKEYINNLSKKASFSLITTVKVNAPILTIKKEYQTYIDMYGFPKNGVFDAELLGNIIKTLNL